MVGLEKMFVSAEGLLVSEARPVKQHQRSYTPDHASQLWHGQSAWIPLCSTIDAIGRAVRAFRCNSSGHGRRMAYLRMRARRAEGGYSTNLTAMAGLQSYYYSSREGSSGGALGIGMGNKIGMLSGGYFGVISPEGC